MHHQKGFTIVELLIVIVVIGILAAITIVAYNGIQNRAKVAAVQADLTGAAKTLEQAKYANAASSGVEQYPALLSNAGLKASSGTTFSNYIVSTTTPANFCVTATNGTTVYSISSTSAGPVEGTCVTNQSSNPGFETNVTSNTVDMGGTGTDSSRSTSTAWADSGSSSALITKTLTVNNPKGTKSLLNQAVVIGDVIRWSYTTRNNTSSTKSFQAYGERLTPTYAALSGATNIGIAAGVNSRQIGQFTIDTNNAGAIGVGVLPNTSFQVGESYNVDSLIVTINEPLPSTYKDGDSAGWAWTGTRHLSTSFGPAV